MSKNHPKEFSTIKSRIDGNNSYRPNILGYIRAGEMTEDKQAKGNNHFRMDSELDDIVARFYSQFSKEPNDIPVYFPYTDDPDDFTRVRTRIYQWEAWNEKRLHGYGDGETNMVWSAASKQYEKAVKGSPLFETIPHKWWKEYLTLRFHIPNMPAGWYGFKTSGDKSSIPHILNFLTIEELEMGGYDNMLFYLTVKRSKQSTTPGSKAVYSVVKLRSAYTPEQKLIIKTAFTNGTLDRKDLHTYLQIEKLLHDAKMPLLKPHELAKLIEK